jgi:hypothetical protein
MGKLDAGKYDIADQEFSSQNYAMERIFSLQGSFEESHVVDHCLLMAMTGKWVQESGTLKLKYDRIRNRPSCHDSLPEWAIDSSELKIPIRNITPRSYEALLAASDGKPEKWVVWNRID